MTERILDHPTAAAGPILRALLARATRVEGPERFWYLAVADQLIAEHLAALAARVATTRSTAHRRRAERAQAGWTRHRARVVATIQHEGHLPCVAG